MSEEDITSKAIELLGTAQPVSKPARKQTLMSYRRGNISMDLRLVSEFDRRTNDYLEPVPRIVCTFDGKYVNMPVDSAELIGLGDFIRGVGEVLDGVDTTQKVDPEMEAERIKLFRRCCLGPQA